jgi:hypothetical protein
VLFANTESHISSKILFARHASSEGSQTSWAYVGSANLSESAW